MPGPRPRFPAAVRSRAAPGRDCPTRKAARRTPGATAGGCSMWTSRVFAGSIWEAIRAREAADRERLRGFAVHLTTRLAAMTASMSMIVAITTAQAPRRSGVCSPGLSACGVLACGGDLIVTITALTRDRRRRDRRAVREQRRRHDDRLDRADEIASKTCFLLDVSDSRC